MPVLQIQTRLPYKTGLPRDLTVNAFNFVTADGSGGLPLLTALGNLVKSFYNDAPGADHPIAYYLSGVINRAACKNVFYNVNLVSGEIGDPVGSTTWTLAGEAAGATPMPLEVAICASYKASDGSIPLARRRGRVYLGPLNTTVLNVTGDYPAPSTPFTNQVAWASKQLATASAALGAPWAVWSRAQAGAYGIDAGWVDNEFDTQRRRGVEATSRKTWAI